MSLTSYRAAPPRVVHVTASSSCRRTIFGVACWRTACDVRLCGSLVVVPARRLRCRLRGLRCWAGAVFGAVCARWRGVRRHRVRAEGSEDLAATDFPAPWGAVSWALVVFTSEFGMGSGAAPPPWPPGRLSPRNAAHRLRRRPLLPGGSGSGAGASSSMPPGCAPRRGGAAALCRLRSRGATWMAAVHGGVGVSLSGD